MDLRFQVNNTSSGIFQRFLFLSFWKQSLILSKHISDCIKQRKEMQSFEIMNSCGKAVSIRDRCYEPWFQLCHCWKAASQRGADIRKGRRNQQYDFKAWKLPVVVAEVYIDYSQIVCSLENWETKSKMREDYTCALESYCSFIFTLCHTGC